MGAFSLHDSFLHFACEMLFTKKFGNKFSVHDVFRDMEYTKLKMYIKRSFSATITCSLLLVHSTVSTVLFYY
jgi:hypothetical protein